MIPTSWLALLLGAAADETLPAVAESVKGVVTTRFEWGRIQSNADWILPIGAAFLILLFVRSMYRRDAAELPAWLSWLLTFLRAATFLGLLVLYLQPQWRSEREVIHDSRVLVLADTSMSMNRLDMEPGASGSGATRLQQVAGALDDTDLLARLRKVHEVGVFQFNNALDRDRTVLLGKTPPPADEADEEAEPAAPTPDTERPEQTWRNRLEPRGTETRLGESLEQLIRDQRGLPLSAIVLLSDGGQNAGVSPDVAVEMARESRIPIFTVGGRIAAQTA